MDIPQELKMLCEAFNSGVDCGFAIHDYMLENNIYPLTAIHHFGGDSPCVPGKCLISQWMTIGELIPSIQSEETYRFKSRRCS